MAPRVATAGAGPPLDPLLPVLRSAWSPVRPWPRPTPPPPPRVPTRQATPLARRIPRMPWARSMRRSQPAAPCPLSTVRPTTTAALRGSSRPTARTASTTVWCRRPEVARTCAARVPRKRYAEDLLDHPVPPKCQRTLGSLATGGFCRVGRLPAALRIFSLQPKDTKGKEQCARTDDAYFW